jgi:hypothetical protein
MGADSSNLRIPPLPQINNVQCRHSFQGVDCPICRSVIIDNSFGKHRSTRNTVPEEHVVHERVPQRVHERVPQRVPERVPQVPKVPTVPKKNNKLKKGVITRILDILVGRGSPKQAKTIKYSNTRKKVTNLGECPICLEDIDSSGCILIGCGHVFHCDCIKLSEQQTFSRECPVCRQRFGAIEPVNVGDPVPNSGKMFTSFGKKKISRIISLNQIKKYIKYLQRL